MVSRNVIQILYSKNRGTVAFCSSLDFFILTSAKDAIDGDPEQVNHAAANVCMNNLAA
jgi:hypothetical protein